MKEACVESGEDAGGSNSNRGPQLSRAREARGGRSCDRMYRNQSTDLFLTSTWIMELIAPVKTPLDPVRRAHKRGSG